MKINRRLGAALLLFIAIGCNKNNVEAPLEIALDMPANVQLRYGEEKIIPLSAGGNEQANGLAYALDFSEIPQVQITPALDLHDVLTDGITIDPNDQNLHIKSALLFPNGAASRHTSAKIPDSYRLRIQVTDRAGKNLGAHTLVTVVTPGEVKVSEVEEDQGIPYAYLLYGEKVKNTFGLERVAGVPTSATWTVDMPENDEKLWTVAGDSLRILSDHLVKAHEAKNKAENVHTELPERSITLYPTLLKDGIPVASTAFRVLLIPQIKFLYGQYYPEYDLTIQLNTIHIALSNGYISNAPFLYPQKYKGSFALKSIEKDGQAFSDTQAIFSINPDTGAINVKKNDTLKAGSYRFMVEATSSVGLTFTTPFTLVMSPLS